MIKLRKVYRSDIKTIFKWRNNNYIVSLSESQKYVSYEEHKKWFSNTFINKNIRIYIIEKNQKAIGQIRFDRINQFSDCADISIYLIKNEQGMGYGSIALINGINKVSKFWNRIKKIKARVLKNNIKSQSFFLKNRFIKVRDSQKLVHYGLEINSKINDLIKNNKDFYDKRVERFGISHKSLNWGSKDSQFKRFEILSQIGNLNNMNILDFGCGTGDLFEWLKRQGIFLSYEGVDISTQMIELAKDRFPGVNFKCQNIFNKPLKKKYDYIFISGVFTYTSMLFLENCLKILFSLCKYGLAFNCLGNTKPIKTEVYEEEFIGNPDEILNFCKSLSTKVIMKDDYHHRDFTIYIYRDENIN